MKGFAKAFNAILLCVSIVLLNSCVPSREYLENKEKGLYPDASDFPNTKWSCREIDMSFYMLDYAESTIIGEYTVNGENYRIVGVCEFSELNFSIYSSTQIDLSITLDELGNPFVNCEQILSGYLDTNYKYQNESIVCSIRNSQAVAAEIIPSTLTFEKVQMIAQQPSVRWCAQEINMYLDSFSDVNGYLKGEMVFNGKKCFVHAFEIGNNGFYRVSIENGIFNNLISKTTSPLVDMYLKITGDKMVAIISEEVISNPECFPYWEYEGAMITFLKNG